MTEHHPTLEDAARAYVAAWHQADGADSVSATAASARLAEALHDLIAIADGECSICDPGSCPLALPDTDERLLTADEHHALALTAELADVGRRIIGDGPCATADWNELAHRIHAVQHMILAQAGARAYPKRYRVLGQTVEAVTS